MKISKLIETSETPELEPLEAILRALTEPMIWSKLYDETYKIKNIHKTTFHSTLERAESQGIIHIHKVDGRTKLISKNFEAHRDLAIIGITYDAIIDEISKLNNELDKIGQSRSKKKFLKNTPFFQALIHHMEKTMYYQKEISFHIQTFYFMTVRENDLLKKYAKLIEQMNTKRFQLIKKIDMKYFHLVYTTLQDRLYQESPEKYRLVHETDLNENAKAIGYNPESLNIKNKSDDMIKFEKEMTEYYKLIGYGEKKPKSP